MSKCPACHDTMPMTCPNCGEGDSHTCRIPPELREAVERLFTEVRGTCHEEHDYSPHPQCDTDLCLSAAKVRRLLKEMP